MLVHPPGEAAMQCCAATFSITSFSAQHCIAASPGVRTKHHAILSPTSSHTKGDFYRGESSTLSNLACAQGSRAKVVHNRKTMESTRFARSQRCKLKQGHPSFRRFITHREGCAPNETVETWVTVACCTLHCTLHNSCVQANHVFTPL
jgi:hypothetical protein